MNRTSNTYRESIRWHFLASASIAALSIASCGSSGAMAEDGNDQPVLWVQIGGQFDLLDDRQQKAQPLFLQKISQAGFASPLKFEKFPATDLEEDAKISFTPEDSDWVFSASVSFARNDSKADIHQTTKNPPVGLGAINTHIARHRYAETINNSSENHDVIDFTAGRDVGLGSLGLKGTSVLSGGVRFAQFRAKSSSAVYANPDYSNPNVTGIVGPKYWHNFSATAKNKTSFSGVGPEISWDASAPVLGNAQNGQVTVDWGVNGAILFGRQKSQGLHETHGKLTTGVLNLPQLGFYYHTTHYTNPKTPSHSRSHMVSVPDAGAKVGFSIHYGRAKISLGYNIDEFFGAIDGGIDSRKRYNFGESGPFVNLAIGLGG